MTVLLIANTMREVDTELRKFYHENLDKVDKYYTRTHMIRFKDGSVIRGYPTCDKAYLNGYISTVGPLQIFVTNNLRYSSDFIAFLFMVIDYSCVPQSYLIQILED